MSRATLRTRGAPENLPRRGPSGPPRRAGAALLSAIVLAGVGATLVGAGAARAGASDSRGRDGRDIMLRCNRAFYYAGRDMRAKMTMELGVGEEIKKLRVMTVLRLNESAGGEQKYLLYFLKPGDVRRMSCMISKHVASPDERWMYVPAGSRVLRVEAPERSSFLGSDFVREEISGRDVDADEHRLLGREKLEGRDCYVIESVPKKIEDFSRCVSWIDRRSYLPIRQEFWDEQGTRSRTFTAGRIAEVPSRERRGLKYPTVMERTMNDVSGRWTRVVLDSVSYDLGLRVSDFSEAHMQTPVSEWLPPGLAEGSASASASPGSQTK